MQIGQRFGSLVVIDYFGKTKHYNKKYLCQCDCGKKRIIFESNLLRGKSTSCGCQRKNALTHGMANTPAYFAWKNILNRCDYPKTDSYKHYGGRGITYDPKWKTFEGFWEDMSSGYFEGSSIDRIDNNGNYSKENCRWVSAKQQARNKRNNHRLTYKGKTQTLVEWAEELNIPRQTLQSRITQQKWSTEKALSTPVRAQYRHLPKNQDKCDSTLHHRL